MHITKCSTKRYTQSNVYYGDAEPSFYDSLLKKLSIRGAPNEESSHEWYIELTQAEIDAIAEYSTEKREASRC